MKLFGVLNASPDSLNTDSVVSDSASTQARIATLVEQDVWGFDLGGQGSTFQAEEVSVEVEWERLAPVLPELVATGRPVSVDTWRVETARRALEAGATWMNAADGLQQDEMLGVARDFGCPVVLPFLSGPDPLRLEHVTGDPLDALTEFFDALLARCGRFGIRHQVVLDPGTGFAPHHWDWQDRFEYQKRVYSNLDILRRYDLPIYIALPWKDTPQHAELMEIIVAAEPDYGRVHYPEQVRAAEERVRAGARRSG